MNSLSLLPLAGPSPRASMDARIAAAASAGTISTTDQSALSTALDGIDSSLKSDAGGRGADMKTRIDGLIDGQVSSGTLTDDQAAELKGFFAQGALRDHGVTANSRTADAGVGGVSAAGGRPALARIQGHGGPPPAAGGDDTTSAATAAAADPTIDEQLKKLEEMLGTLRQSLTQNGTYAPGSATASSGLLYRGIA